MTHVAHIDFVEFYTPAFASVEDARAFVDQVEKIPTSQSPAKTILHQGARMIWLADRMEEVAKARPGLRILFYLIAAGSVCQARARLPRRRSVKKACADLL